MPSLDARDELSVACALLQRHAEDAAAEVEALLDACEGKTRKPCPLTLGLRGGAAAALAFAAAFSDDVGVEAEALHSKLLVSTEPLCCSTRSRSWPTTAEAAIVPERARTGADWGHFDGLPIELDGHRFDSTIGRKLSAAVARVADQQQRVLAQVRGGQEEQETQRLHSTAVKMKQLVARALHLATLGTDGERCSSCADTRPGVTLKPTEAATDDDTSELIVDKAALESYLETVRARSSAGARDGDRLTFDEAPLSIEDTQVVRDQDAQLTCFRRLLRAVSVPSVAPIATVSEKLIVSDVVQGALNELSLIVDARVLGIQVSFLLAAQANSKRVFATQDAVLEDRLVRQIVREFNSLTVDEADKERGVRTLLQLAGFSPTLMVREIVARAIATPQYIDTYVRVLELCPLLAKWCDGESESPVIFSELQLAIRRLVTHYEQFEAQRHYLLELLCALTGLSCGDESGQATIDATKSEGWNGRGVIEVHDLLREVILPMDPVSFGDDDDSGGFGTQAADYSTLLRDFVHSALADSCWKASRRGLQALEELLFKLVKRYSSVSTSKTLSVCGIEIESTLLLTLEDIMVFIASLPEAAASGILEKCIGGAEVELDEKILALIGHLFPFAVIDGSQAMRHKFTELCITLWHSGDPFALDGAAVFDSASRASHTTRLLLWKLLWSSAVGVDTEASQQPGGGFVAGSDERSLAWLSALARTRVIPAGDDSDAAETDVTSYSGTDLLLKELARVMRSCRASLSTRLIGRVALALVKAVFPSTAQCLQTPEQLLSQDAGATTLSTGNCGELPPPHAVVHLVARCWSSLVFASVRNSSDEERNSVLYTTHHLLAACDIAISESQASLRGLLRCLQRICYAAFALSCSRMAQLESCAQIQTQLDVRMLRVLHMLNQLRVVNEADAAFSRQFVASWLAVLPLSSFKQATNFVAAV